MSLNLSPLRRSASSALVASTPLLGPLTPIPRNQLFLPPQGGACVATSQGLMHFGVNPWINKWAHGLYRVAGGEGLPRDEVRHYTPTVFIHDSEFSGPDVGLIPFDFLGYMGFVVGGAIYTFVAENPAQAARLDRYLRLSYLGQRRPDLTERVIQEYPDDVLALPDMLAEIERGFDSPPSETRWRVQSTNADGRIQIGGVSIERLGNQRFRITDGNDLIGTLDLKKFPQRPFRLRQSPASRSRLEEVKRLALGEGKAGLWPIGTSDGFDPKGATSGFMIWNQGCSLLVDPPSHTLDYLKAVGVPLDRIDGLILTHGHTDHCGDVVPRLLRKRPGLSIRTTPVIHDMLSEQFELAVGENILKWGRFEPVFPGRQTEINGMRFEFNYTLHNVPAIGYEIWRKSGELAHYFSGDTLASPAAVKKLSQPGPQGEPPVLDFFREIQILRHYPYALIASHQEIPPVFLIEAGIPPIHTPPAETRVLIEDLQRDGLKTSHILTYHISRRRARRERVPRWKEGHAGWIDLHLT